jgi:hypothetical protein
MVNSGAVPSLVGSDLQANTFLQLLYGGVQATNAVDGVRRCFSLARAHLFSLDSAGVSHAPPSDTGRDIRRRELWLSAKFISS